MSRAVIAREAVDAAFEDLGTPATYTPPGGGAAVACMIQRARPDEAIELGTGRIVEATDMVDVRASEVAAPAKGGTFTVEEAGGPTTLTITAKPMTTDSERLIWRCPVVAGG